MAVFNNTARLYRKCNVKDVFSKYDFAAPVAVPCSYFRQAMKVTQTSVRTSASHGRAEEDSGSARALFPPGTIVAVGDVCEIDGAFLEVTDATPMRLTYGPIDHVQVDFRAGKRPAN